MTHHGGILVVVASVADIVVPKADVLDLGA